MKKTKKALLAALACSVVLVGAGAIAACNKDDGGDEGHSHSWNAWTVADADKPTFNAIGKAKRTCKNSGCDATTEQLEVTLPQLDNEGYTTEVTTEATCMTEEVVTYTYTVAEGETVSFTVTGEKNDSAHDYTYTIVDGGHSAVCKHNSQHTIAKEDHDTKGEGGACSKCGYHEIQLNTDVTVKGATDKEPKLYYINLTVSAEEGVETNYRIMSGGAALATGDKVDLVKDGTPIDSETYDSAITIEEAGLYCVKVYEDLTFSVVPYTHKHGFDTNTWAYDKTNHWNPATCKHEDEKGNEGLHSFKPATNPDADNVSYMECGTCAYRKYNYHGTALTNGGTISPAENGNYAATLGTYDGSYGWGKPKYYVDTMSVTLKNEGTEAKKYTVKVLTDGTKIGECTKGQSYSFVLEPDATTNISIASETMAEVDKDFSLDAAFRVTIDEAPAAGDKLRPISVTLGTEFGKTVATDEKVYFSIEGTYGSTYGKKVAFTFADGISVYSLGGNIDNEEPTLIGTGEYATLSSFGDNYFYAVASTAGDCKVTANFFYLDGEKEKPLTAKTDGTANSVALSQDTYEMWYKVEGLTNGKQYMFKVNSSIVTLKLYKDPSNEWQPDAQGGEGESVMITSDGTTPLYLKVSGVEACEVVISEVSDADKGLVSALPFEVTVAGQLDVKSGTFFYAITPTESGEAVLSCENLSFTRYSDAGFKSDVTSATGSLTFTVEAGTTYYVKTINNGEATGKITLEFKTYTPHDYVITLSDGTNTYKGATVTLVYTGGEITGATDNGDGTYTFANVDSSRDYTVKVTGLPEEVGYREGATRITKNFDETSAATVTVLTQQEYKVKVALPTGSTLPEGASLAGIRVTLATVEYTGPTGREYVGVVTVETDAEGVATLKALDPDYSYTVLVEVSTDHSLYGKFAYIPASGYGRPSYTTVNEEKRDITDAPIALTAVKTYTVSFSGATLEQGTKVTLNDEEYTVGADGTFQVILVPGSNVQIEVEGYTVTKTVNEETNTIAVTLGEDESKLTLDKEVTVTGVAYPNGKLYEITLEAGNYKIILDGSEFTNDGDMDFLFGNEFADGDVYPIVPRKTDNLLVVEEDSADGITPGKYYIKVYKECTFKIIKV